jgi:hypothetical protein
MNLIKKYCINFMNIINKNLKFIVMALKENNRKFLTKVEGGTGGGVGGKGNYKDCIHSKKPVHIRSFLTIFKQVKIKKFELIKKNITKSFKLLWYLKSSLVFKFGLQNSYFNRFKNFWFLSWIQI